MPELPEVETIARELHELVAGSTISEVHIRKADVLREVSARTFRRRVTGRTITCCYRRAKLAVMEFDNSDRIAVQPRFTGALLVESDARPLDPHDSRYSTLHFSLEDGRRLHYSDVRRLGTVTLMTAARFEEHIGSLGVEPLADEFTAGVLSGILRGSRQAVKKLIMDQTRVVGVGNIYANEALWRAGIDPSRTGAKVSREEAALLHDSIRSVLAEAIEARGTTFRDYRSASGEGGEFVVRLDAYGRAGLPCRRCGRRMVGTHAIDGRATVLCAGCQR